ncbi:hypothetical protein HHI36_003110 [Cryptolaemus montrouzieri]|uniref:Uncharacterized protein n=1 Tax=Cryptolaemus montrouzieri TaxID=559131 RepID=A0ABD2PCZ8_9CUCU
MLNVNRCAVLFSLVTMFIENRCHKCVSFNNITLIVHQRYGDPFNITSFSGCIERVSFGDASLTEIYIRQQNVTSIGEDSIRHMVRLKTLVFWGCPVRNISAGAIRNVPRLQNLQISYGNLERIKEDIFNEVPTVQLLRLHDNAISVIENNAFSNLRKLKKIFMANNKLKQWKNSWFTNTTNLEIIDFQKNQLEIIPRKAFNGMSHLKQLFLDYNEIKAIEEEAFKGIRELDYLGLRYNRLIDLDAKIFPNNLTVRSLLIDANYLNYLPNELLEKLSVKDLTLDGNPWKCPCLDRIHYWLFSSNATLRTSTYCTGSDIPLCSYPESYSQTCLENIDEQITRTYIDGLKQLKRPLRKFCARLD